MVDAFKKMETDAWDLAAKVMTPKQLDELFDVIVDWHSQHPDQVAVDYVRFSEFGNLGKKPNLKQIQKPGGLLAPVREATAAVDEVRMTSERAMFLLTKMQLIMGFQAELVYKQLVIQPEMESLFEDISGFRTTADRFADLLEQLPNRVADERSAMFTDAERLIAGERTAALEAFDDKATVIHQINKGVQETLRARAKITSHFRISASAHLWLIPHSQKPRNSLLFLWFCSLGSAKPRPNLSANSAKLFFREPLAELTPHLTVFGKQLLTPSV